MESDHKTATDKLKTKIGELMSQIDKIFDYFPQVKELLNMENFCRTVGFGTNMIKRLFNHKEVGFRGKIYSHEYERKFETENSTAKLEPDPTSDRPHKFRLTIDRLDIYDWFRQKHKEFLSSIGINIKEPKNNRGVKM